MHDTFGVGISSLSKAVSTFYDAGPTILHCLKQTLADEIKAPTTGRKDDSNSIRLRLWVLYVGSLAEQISRAFPASTELQAQFVLQSKELGYSSFHEVRELLLKGFLYDDSRIPRAAMSLENWFDEALSCE